MSEWQPIETAPKDGAPFLACMDWRVDDLGKCCVIRWRAPISSRSPGQWLSIPGDWSYRPTHWMPLPEPPQ